MSCQPLGMKTPKYNTVKSGVSEDTEHSIPGLKALGHALPHGLRKNGLHRARSDRFAERSVRQ